MNERGVHNVEGQELAGNSNDRSVFSMQVGTTAAIIVPNNIADRSSANREDPPVLSTQKGDTVMITFPSRGFVNRSNRENPDVSMHIGTTMPIVIENQGAMDSEINRGGDESDEQRTLSADGSIVSASDRVESRMQPVTGDFTSVDNGWRHTCNRLLCGNYPPLVGLTGLTMITAFFIGVGLVSLLEISTLEMGSEQIIENRLRITRSRLQLKHQIHICFR